jgi:hypothetical protein
MLVRRIAEIRGIAKLQAISQTGRIWQGRGAGSGDAIECGAGLVT